MWTAVSWATLFTSLTVGRESRRANRWAGLGVLAAGIGLAVAWFLGADPGGWSVLVGACAFVALLLVAGTIALGRLRRVGSAFAIYPLTLLFSPFVVLGFVLAMVLVVYLLVEDAPTFPATRHLLRSIFVEQQRRANLATPSGARIIAMRLS
jgi:hypothetical protein